MSTSSSKSTSTSTSSSKYKSRGGSKGILTLINWCFWSGSDSCSLSSLYLSLPLFVCLSASWRRCGGDQVILVIEWEYFGIFYIVCSLYAVSNHVRSFVFICVQLSICVILGKNIMNSSQRSLCVSNKLWLRVVLLKKTGWQCPFRHNITNIETVALSMSVSQPLPVF